jgi:predicted ribosome quality control (RQC) complex YloA/Tae2 family protein
MPNRLMPNKINPYFDALLLYSIIKEFQQLKGQRVKKVRKDTENNLYLIFSKSTFLASTHPSFYRVLLLSQKPATNLQKHRFEDYLKSTVISTIKQLSLDRIFYIGFKKGGENCKYCLVFELTGPSSRISLLDSNRKIVAQQGAVKGEELGEPFLFHGKSISEMEMKESKKILDEILQSDSIQSNIKDKFKKLPPWFKKFQNHKEEDLKKALENPEPYVVFEDDHPAFVSLMRTEGKSKKTGSLSAAVNELYEYFIKEERKNRISKELRKKLKSKHKTLKKLNKELDNARSSEVFKKKGDLILLNLKDIKKGDKIIKLNDPLQNNIVEIKMDPSKTPIKNAEDYFKKYKKARRSKSIVHKRIKNIKQEIKSLKKQQESIHNLSGTELKALEKQFLKQKEIKTKLKETKKFRIFKTHRGKTVLVGRNKYENDRLTRTAKSEDIFFHVREAPGSHTILVNDGDLSKVDIIDAAKIAAHFSKAKHSKLVPVSYTEKKYVRKSKKLGPGKVFITREKTVFVEPEIPEIKK